VNEDRGSMKNRIYLKTIAFLLCLIGISVLLFIVFGLIENIIDKGGLLEYLKSKI